MIKLLLSISLNYIYLLKARGKQKKTFVHLQKVCLNFRKYRKINLSSGKIVFPTKGENSSGVCSHFNFLSSGPPLILQSLSITNFLPFSILKRISSKKSFPCASHPLSLLLNCKWSQYDFIERTL